MATGECRSLPAELWTRVLRNLDNEEEAHPELWMLRHVSATFKGIVEFFFRKRHLQKTWIEFGTLFFDRDIPRFRFTFSHLSEDGVNAIFRLNQRKPHGFNENDVSAGVLFKALQHYATELPLCIHTTKHVIQIRHNINDTPIPGLSFTFDNLKEGDDADKSKNSDTSTPEEPKDPQQIKLGCNWRDLYTRFYGEERLSSKKQGAWVADLKVKKDQGEPQPDMMESMQQFFAMYQESKKLARRARIRRQVEEWKEYPSSERFRHDSTPKEEKVALMILSGRQQDASLEEFSDDEEEERNDEYEEEDEEEDEDEDEENAV